MPASGLPVVKRDRPHKRRPHGAGREPSQRQLRVGEVLRHELARLFERGAIHDPALAGASITVSEVAMSPDLRTATAYVLPLGGGEADRLVAELNRVAPALRRMMAPALTLRFLPELRFETDTTFERASRIEALLREAGGGTGGGDEP